MKKSAEDLALSLLAGALRGGATVATDVNGTVPEAGFAVGGAQRTAVLSTLDIQAYDVEHWCAEFRNSAQYLGVWRVDTSVYLDCVTIVGTLAHALDLARAYGEIAVFDLAAKREIMVD